MALDVNTVFQHAQTLGPGADDAKVYLRENGAIEGQTRVGAIKAFFTNARTAENRASIDAFIQSIRDNPQFAGVRDGVVSWLGELRGAGGALTAGQVRETQERLHTALLERHHHTGLAMEGVAIPPGEAMQFASYCAGRGIPAAPAGEAVKAYCALRMEAEFVQMHKESGQRGGLRGLSEQFARVVTESPAFTSTLNSLYGGENIPEYETVAAALRLRTSHVVDVLDQTSPYFSLKSFTDTFNSPVGQAKLDLLARAREAGTISLEEIGDAYSALGPHPVEEYALALVEFRYKTDATELMAEKLAGRGLPQAWAANLAHRPEILAALMGRVAENGFPPGVPSSAQMREILAGAPFMDEMLDRHAAKLEECRQLVANTPERLTAPGREIDTLTKPLTEKRMGQLINAMLDADFLLESASGEEFDPAAFLRQMDILKVSLLVGLPGGPDFAEGVGDVINIQLARWDVPTEARSGLAEQAIRRWVPLLNGLESVYDEAVNDISTPAEIAFSQIMRANANLLTYGLMQLAGGLSDEAAQRLGLERGEPNAWGVSHLKMGALTDARMPLDRIPAAVRDFAAARGREMPPLAAGAGQPDRAAEVNRSLNDSINKSQAGRITDQVAAEFFRTRGTGDQPAMFYTALDSVAGWPDDFDPAGMDASVLHNAFRQAAQRHVDAGRVLDEAAARTLAMNTIRQSLEAILQGTEGRPATRAAMLAYPLSANDTQNILARAARNVNHLNMHGAGGPTLARALEGMAGNMMALFAARGLPQPPDLSALQNMSVAALVDLCMEGGRAMAPDQLFAHLTSPAANETARDLATVALLPGLPDDRRQQAETAAALLRLLRCGMGARLGLDTPPLLSHPREHPADIASPQFWGYALDAGMATSLGKVNPPLTRDQWNAIAALMEPAEFQFQQQGQGALSRGALVVQMAMQGAAEPLAQAFRDAAPGQPTPQIIWRAVMGQGMPRGLDTANLFPAMCEAMLQQARTLGNPDMRLEELSAALQFVSFPKLLEINREGGRLSLADLREDPTPSSLRDYHAGNAYGLVTDYARAGGGEGRFTFHLNETTGREFTPHHIPHQENTPNNPEFVRIIETARLLCGGHEGQAVRLLQCCSQATLVLPRMLSTAFPGVPMVSEHGSFTMEARRRPNGDVEVIRDSMQDAPLAVHMVYVLKPDGTVQMEALDIAKRG